MADERRKGLADRRRARNGKSARAAEESVTPPAGAPDVNATDQARGQDPNDVARFDAEQLDKSIRAREQEDRGEVF